MAGTNFKVKNGLEIQSGTVIAGGGAGTSGQVLSSTGTGVQWVNASSGSGTVTSVGVSGANGIGVTNSPITTSGTIALSLGAITPTSISTGTGTFSGDVEFAASIKSPVASNSPVIIAPDGTGDVHLNADSVRIGDNNADATIATRGTGDLLLTTNEGSAVEGVIRIYDGANGNITLTPNGTGQVQVGSDQVVTLTASQTLTNKTLSSNSVWNGNVIGSAYGGAGTVNGILKANGSGTVSAASAGTDYVTSVSVTSPVSNTGTTANPTIALASGYGDTQNPYGSKTANYFLAAPNGTAGSPTFRAIVAADIPTLNQNTTGTAANITASSNTTLTSLSNLATVGTITSGTWSGSFGAVSGANLTSLTAGNLSGTIPSGVLGNSTLYVGTTAVALNRASANQALTGISSITLAGATSGTVQFIPTAAVGTGTVLTIPATTGTIVTTGDSGTVTSTMIADGTIVNADINASAAIAVSKLSASTISGVTLGGTLSTLTLNTSGTGLSGSTTYNGSAAATFTVTSNATSANTASTIVARDASGNFSAGTITATLSGNASTATSATSATTATNLSGGSVAATTGTFSGTVTIKSGSALGKLTVQTGGSDPVSPAAGDMVWYY